MADLAKCFQEHCPLHPTCRRYTAAASARQSWIAPLQVGVDCPFYWPTPAAAEVLAAASDQPIPADPSS